eukprot:IDg12429t1
MISLMKYLVCVLFVLVLPLAAVGQRTAKRVGAVYAMSNNVTRNTVLAYSRGLDGKISLIGEYPTGGKGAVLNVGAPDDPLFSQFSVLLTSNRRFLLAVNPGSNTVSVFRVLRGFGLRLVSQQQVPGFGPVTIAQIGKIVYVASADADSTFTNALDQEGMLSGFKLLRSGRLLPLPRSSRNLPARPSAIRFSPDGRFLLVSELNAGSITLATGSEASIVVFGVRRNGLLSPQPLDTATSTLRGNTEGRNLPVVIGIEVVQRKSGRYVVATESRVFLPDGTPGTPDQFQTGSVSSWRIANNGTLIPISQDVLTGDSFTSGSQAACWLTFSRDGDNFWVS